MKPAKAKKRGARVTVSRPKVAFRAERVVVPTITLPIAIYQSVRRAADAEPALRKAALAALLLLTSRFAHDTSRATSKVVALLSRLVGGDVRREDDEEDVAMMIGVADRLAESTPWAVATRKASKRAPSSRRARTSRPRARS